MCELSVIPNKFYEEVLHKDIVDGIYHKNHPVKILTTIVPETWRPKNKEFTDKVEFVYKTEEKFK